jgi:DNA polymerase-3 subunit gamma/tau
MAKPKKADLPPEKTPRAESYTVLARRYRPQVFGEVVGQEAIAQALTNALKTNRVAHAYLFTGPRGVGKTTTARILAKCLNCEKGPTPTPCGVCDSCQGIASGEDVDVLEIDAASNRGIDDIRNLRSNVQYRPSRARYKVYIIDEVHMLSKDAANALLKTLEEPPPHIKFIFATTDPQKLLVTILSRCQRFDLAGINLTLIKKRLEEIVTAEGMAADDEALELIARRAGGSMRDAQSLLDQLLAFSSDRLTTEQVHNLLGTASDEHIIALAECILGQDPRQTLERVDEAIAQGFQMGELVEQLIAYWRDLMVVHCAASEARDLSVPPRQRETLQRQATGLQLDTILAGLDILSTTRARLRDSSHPRTLVEMALVRLSRLGDLVSLAQMCQWLIQVRSDTTSPAPAKPQLASQAGRLALPPEAVKKNAPILNRGSEIPTTLTAETLPEIWGQLLRQVGTLLASDLAKADLPAIIGPNSLVIRFAPAYNQAREFIQEPTRLTRIEETLKKLLGKPWTLRVESVSGPAVAPPVVAETPPPVTLRVRRISRDEAEKEPLVKRAVEALSAQVVRVDDGFGAVVTAETSEQFEAAIEEDS